MLSADPTTRRYIAATYLLPALLINIGNVAAYLFQLVLGRSMSAADFGTFNAAFSMVLMATAPMGVAHLIVAHVGITIAQKGRAAEAALFRICLATGAAAGLVLIIGFLPFVGPVMRDLTLDRMTVLAALLTVAFAFLQPVPAGMIQARGDHFQFALVQGSIALFRLAAGISLVTLLGLGVGGAMSACAVSLLFALLLGLWLERHTLSAAGVHLPLDEVGNDAFRFGWPQLVTAILTSALTNLDVILVRLFDSADASGLYAGASVIGRMGLLLPGALTGIIFVEAARNRASVNYVLFSLGFTCALAACVLLPVLVAPKFILGLLLGPRYVDAQVMLQLTTAAMCCLAVAQAAMMHMLGRRQYAYMSVLACAAVTFLIAAATLRPDALGMAWLLLATNAFVLAGCVLLVIAVARKEEAQPAGAAA